MTDKEIVERAKEAEKRTGFGKLVHSPISKGINSAFGIGFIEGMVEYRNSMQEEPVSKDKFTFTSLPRLLDRIKPTDRAKWYSIRLADALEKEGYITDAKIVRESIKIMNGEKVAMATMDEEPVSEYLEKIVEEIAEPTILNAYGTKELARRLRNAICGTSVSEDLEKASEKFRWNIEESCYQNDNGTYTYSSDNIEEAFKAGAKWQKQKDNNNANHALVEQIKTQQMCYEKGMADMKQQMMSKAVDGDITFDYYGDDDKTYGCIAHNSFCLEDFGLKDRDKVKVIVIKED